MLASFGLMILQLASVNPLYQGGKPKNPPVLQVVEETAVARATCGVVTTTIDPATDNTKTNDINQFSNDSLIVFIT